MIDSEESAQSSPGFISLASFLTQIVQRKLGYLLNHGLFCTQFLTFIVISSIPRIIVILDTIIIFCVYINSIDTKKNATISFDSISALIFNDFLKYKFATSAIDFFALKMGQCTLFFMNFSYKQQKNRSNQKLMLCFYFSSLLSLFSMSKLLFCLEPRAKPLIYYSLCSAWVSLFVFYVFRKARIPRRKIPQLLDKYNLLPLDEELGLIEKANLSTKEMYFQSSVLSKLKEKEKSREWNLKNIAVDDIQVKYKIIKNTNYKKSDDSIDLVIFKSFLSADWNSFLNELNINHKNTILIEYPLTIPSQNSQDVNTPSTSKTTKTAFSRKILTKLAQKFNVKKMILLSHSFLCIKAVEAIYASNENADHARVDKMEIQIFPEIKAIVLVSPSRKPLQFVNALLNTRLEEEAKKKLLKVELNSFLPRYCVFDENTDFQMGNFDKIYPKLVQLAKEKSSELFGHGNKICLDKKTKFLCVFGKDDKLATESDLKYIKRLTKATVIRLKDCGHNPQIERPRILAENISDFILN